MPAFVSRTNNIASRALMAAVATAMSATLMSCTSAEPEPQEQRFTQNGVDVTLRIAKWESSTGTLEATFAPTTADFHLYSTDLPENGVEGVGRPTKITFKGALDSRSAPTASEAVHTIPVEGVTKPVPVYPDGPVTLTVPIHATGDGDATVLVSYASCSTSDGCTIPVVDHPVSLHVAEEEVTFAPH
ncbi:hypothetical protein [Streptomyces sp. NPDC058572]|uniref:hypothetical protein n=1 Tax=Streptomyces sp. NPDC058572 TaxID=3346546 RepID=UPI003667ECC9